VFATASATASPASTTGAGTRRSRCRNDVTSRVVLDYLAVGGGLSAAG
jgi:hypothetical protein